MTQVAVLDSGVANLASVLSAFRRLGAEATVARHAHDLEAVSHLVLPGVGAFGAGMRSLRAHGLDRVVTEWVEAGRPLLAVCLGMQLLCDGSEESPGVAGLGLLPGLCRRLPDSVLVPHLGWNRINAPSDARWLASGEAAFANSYALLTAPTGAAAAWTTHGVPFVAAVEWGPVLACQFHPELSAAWGLALLARWLGVEASGKTAGAGARAPGLIRRLVPCLDVRDGRVVKGVRFQHLRDAGDPAARAAEYEQQGADELVLLDIAASGETRTTRAETVQRVRDVLALPLTVGGGVRDVEQARTLLRAGADKVSVNTGAVARPDLVAELAREFGTQCVVVAIDARRTGRGWETLVMGGRTAGGLDAAVWAHRAAELGAGEILLTSWDRDGTRAGCDLELIGAVTRAVRIPVIASGGVGNREHVARAFEAGAAAVLAASIFHNGDDTVRSIKLSLAARGVPVRL